MPLDFGSIREYNTERGFGYLHRTVWKQPYSTSKVFFHIKKVKHKYPDLARQLDLGAYDGLCFWYDTESTPKGEQASEIWLEAGDIPASLRDSIANEIEKQWLDIESDVSRQLEKLTIDLFGQDRRNRLDQERERRIQRHREEEENRRRLREESRRKLEMERQIRLEAARVAAEEQRRKAAEIEAQRQAELAAARAVNIQRRAAELRNRSTEIQRLCRERDIQTLVHFTRIRNLYSILRNGLIGRNALEQLALDERPVYNDSGRWDGHEEAICLSISFPNYRMFYKYSNDNRSEWVVLLLDPAVLWELDCVFCHENAASNAVRFISLEERRQVHSFERMFADYGHIRRINLGIPDNYPTHPQAEVLALEPILPRYITGVHFPNLDACQRWYNTHQGDYVQKFFYGDTYFVPRKDWPIWSNQNRVQFEF